MQVQRRAQGSFRGDPAYANKAHAEEPYRDRIFSARLCRAGPIPNFLRALITGSSDDASMRACGRAASRRAQVQNRREETMRKVALRFGLTLAAVAMALPMMAKTDKPAKSDVKTKNTSIMIGAPVKFGDTMVKP